MRSGPARLYLVAATLVLFFVLWATIAAHPWARTAAAARPEVDPRLAALERRERRLRHEAAVVKRAVDRRWAAYRSKLRAREAAIAATKLRHARRLAAARAAQARIAALAARAAAAAPAQPRTVTTYRVTRVQAPSAPALSAPAAPPPVRVVTLPPATAPATRSTSSAP